MASAEARLQELGFSGTSPVACCLTHSKRWRLSKRSLKTCPSSLNTYFPELKHCRSTCESMVFVRQSANMACDATHLTLQFSRSLSRISKHSIVVRCSAHWGSAVRVNRSYADLQSVTKAAGVSWGSNFSGCVHSHFGFRVQAQRILSHMSLSTVLLRAAASAPNVLLTTRGTRLLVQATGATIDLLFSNNSRVVTKMRVPWWALCCLFDMKEASEKAQKVTFPGEIGKTINETGFCFASASTLLAVTRSEIVARLMADCSSPTFAAKSGLVWTAAYCKAPTMLLSELFSVSLREDVNWDRRPLSMVTGEIFSTYEIWSYSMLKSSHCFKFIPVYLNSCLSKAPKLNRASTLFSILWKTLSPPAMPSSTWMPRQPWHFNCPFGSSEYRPKTQGSSGHCMHPWRINSSLNSQNQRYGASILPYAPPSSAHWSVPDIWRASLSSGGAWIPKVRPSPLPCKNAVLMSKDNSSQPWLATFCKTVILPSFVRVGASLVTTSIPGSSKPMITKRALAFMPWLESSPGFSFPDAGFQFKIHRHLIRAFSGILPLLTFLTVLWWSHARISLSFAAANNLIMFTQILQLDFNPFLSLFCGQKCYFIPGVGCMWKHIPFRVTGIPKLSAGGNVNLHQLDHPNR